MLCRFTLHQKALIAEAAEGDRRMQREAEQLLGNETPPGLEFLFIHGHPSKVQTTFLPSYRPLTSSSTGLLEALNIIFYEASTCKLQCKVEAILILRVVAIWMMRGAF